MPIMTNKQRSLVVATAKDLLFDGCHFVNGGRGDKPGDADTPLDKPKASVTLATLSLNGTVPVVQAAKSWKGGTICQGRFDRVGGRALSTSDPALANYLKRMRSKVARGDAHDKLPPMETLKGHILTPRTVGGRIILGESCVGRRHFDCVDFVNYCYSVALVRRWQFSLGQYEGGIAGKTAVAKKTRLMEGDIVLRGSVHCGICHKANNGQWKVFEAPGGSKGVIESLFREHDWDRRVRVSFYKK